MRRFDAHLDVAYRRLYTNRQCIKYWNSRYASLRLCNLQVRIRDLALDGIRLSLPNLGLLVLSKLDGFDCVVHVLCHLDLHSLICQYIISSFVSCPTIQSADFDGTVGGCKNNCQQLKYHEISGSNGLCFLSLINEWWRCQNNGL